jgi:hypothetical protein
MNFCRSDEFFAKFRENSGGVASDLFLASLLLLACATYFVACAIDVDFVPAVASIPADAGVPLVPDALTVAAWAPCFC